MESSIIVSHLVKNYHQTVRQPGLGSAFRALFHQERRVVHAVRDITFTLQPGELVGFLGPNGAGKTTTLKILSGILFPTSGEVRVLGHVPWERHNVFRRAIAIVMGQRNQLWWDLPVIESIVLNKILYQIPEQEFDARLRALSTLLEVTDLLPVQVRKLSLGQRMRCELIAALIHQPSVLFLDEPTIGLDVVSQKKIRDFLREYVQQKRTTILLTSHNMEDIEELCRRVLVINEGTLIYDGLLADLRSRYATSKSITVTFANAPDEGAFVGLGKVESYDHGVVRLSVPRERTGETARAILAQHEVLDISIEEEKVESIIRTIFAGRGTD